MIGAKGERFERHRSANSRSSGAGGTRPGKPCKFVATDGVILIGAVTFKAEYEMIDDWQEIRRQCGPLVWATVYRILRNHDQALDCVQEIFLEAFERSEEFVVEDWSAWLRWLAVRRALDRLRNERRAAAHISPDYDVTSCVGGPEPCAQAEFRELVDRVRLEMARLPDRQAEAFWLRCVEEMSYEEVAEQMGTDANSIGVLIHRARSRLRDLLADLNPSRVNR